MIGMAGWGLYGPRIWVDRRYVGLSGMTGGGPPRSGDGAPLTCPIECTCNASGSRGGLPPIAPCAAAASATTRSGGGLGGRSSEVWSADSAIGCESPSSLAEWALPSVVSRGFFVAGGTECMRWGASCG